MERSLISIRETNTMIKMSDVLKTSNDKTLDPSKWRPYWIYANYNQFHGNKQLIHIDSYDG